MWHTMLSITRKDAKAERYCQVPACIRKAHRNALLCSPCLARTGDLENKDEVYQVGVQSRCVVHAAIPKPVPASEMVDLPDWGWGWSWGNISK